jgi:hypothetical protein
MAFQKGIIKIGGELGDMSFYKGKTRKNKSAHLVKTKSGVDAATIKNSPAFSRTRENMSEFALAGEMSKIIYNESSQVTNGARDTQASSRLTAAFRNNLAKDAANLRGERQIQWDDAAELLGYEFNTKRRFGATWGKAVTATGNGTDVVVSFQDIIPMYDIKAQSEASHAQLEVCVVKIGVDGTVTSSTQVSGFIACNLTSATPIGDLSFDGAQTDAETVIVVASVKTYQELNGVHNALKNQAYNAATIVNVIV